MKYLRIFGFLFLASSLSAQLSIAVDAVEDSIYFGDEVVFNYKVNVPANVNLSSIDFNPLKEIKNAAYEQDSVMFEEFMDVDIIDGGTFGINDANLIVNGQSFSDGIPTVGSIKVRISTIGAFLLPVPELGLVSPQAIMPLQRKPLYVLPRGQAIELNENKPIIEEQVSWKDYLKYLYGLLAAVGLIFLGLYLNKRLQKEEDEVVEEVVEVRRPAHVIALEDLNNLRSKQLWQNGEEKAYHTELTRIMRQYVEDRYEVGALEMTTSQLKKGMAKKNIDSDIIATFTDILQIADKVKFAKGVTGPEINERFMEEALQIVNTTKQIAQIQTEE